MSVMASRPPNMPAGAGGGPSKRPRLSLQIKASFSQPNGGRPTTSRAFSLNPSDPTAFNTLSNAYVTAIERSSTPIASPIAGAGEPLTAISTFQSISLCSPVRARPVSAYPATPLSAHPAHPATTSPAVTLPLPSATMSPTPPVSAAGCLEGTGSRVFSFSPRDAAAGRRSLEQALNAAAAAATNTPVSPMATPPKQQQQQQQFQQSAAPARATLSTSPPPYTHAKALRSILRNSPLPSRRTCSSSSSPRRLTPPPMVRIQAPERRPAKRVCYHSPIEQEITTNLYTKSHIDLLVEEATSPCSPQRLPVDLSRVFSANEIRDGGQTPGGSGSSGNEDNARTRTGGVKRTASRSEKKRRWVWTIGREEDAEEGEEHLGGAVVAAARAAAAAAAATGAVEAPPVLLGVPKPKVKLDMSAQDVVMS
ncbi:hypothetical protein ISF_01748 [Cordyceps fumosorosea ARSEF 2679]|uniref:Uncharacterized protein n=1 Tax=Cordyceps fumosorosea (strain ARSEF 2679) TaxID=1081104 RepID=A0A168CBR9_CORFA|nr:hypothetical protein ISF_01748 [Cordyceps fumosorosea ARSEF 2679]OAA71197.1 hypothetical protein ISF_01748 [Cordyceps fumosorosea ARSEF 2679]